MRGYPADLLKPSVDECALLRRVLSGDTRVRRLNFAQRTHAELAGQTVTFAIYR